MSWYWAVVRGDCGIVSANATVRVRSLMTRGIDRDPNQMGLASSIGINRKGTRAGRGRQRKMWYRMWYEIWGFF